MRPQCEPPITPTYGAGEIVPDLPRTGMIAEGSGTAAADSHGAHPINPGLSTSTNYTWRGSGISLAVGLIQTPGLPNVCTVAIFYKTTRASAQAP